jgi:hypothetical protein
MLNYNLAQVGQACPTASSLNDFCRAGVQIVIFFTLAFILSPLTL